MAKQAWPVKNILTKYKPVAKKKTKTPKAPNTTATTKFHPVSITAYSMQGCWSCPSWHWGRGRVQSIIGHRTSTSRGHLESPMERNGKSLWDYVQLWEEAGAAPAPARKWTQESAEHCTTKKRAWGGFQLHDLTAEHSSCQLLSLVRNNVLPPDPTYYLAAFSEFALLQWTVAFAHEAPTHTSAHAVTIRHLLARQLHEVVM